MPASPAWREYQNRTAEFFRHLGLEATVDHRLEGARGVHSVDVFVEGAFHGIRFRWVVECKDWTTNVPKEKVMALFAIVQDVGADRGFLLSEKGFQSGAVRAARKTNVTLSSLEDLAGATEEYFVDATIGSLTWRLLKARKRLRRIKKEKFDDDYEPPMMKEMGELFILEAVLEDAAKNEYPITFWGERQIATFDELVKLSDAIITAAELWSPPDQSAMGD